MLAPRKEVLWESVEKCAGSILAPIFKATKIIHAFSRQKR